MSESKRTLLRSGASIRLTRSLEEPHFEEWTITGCTGGKERCEGGSSVCYDAVHNGIPGRLKEYYPGDVSVNGRDWLFHFERSRDGQLKPMGEAMTRRFHTLCDDFLAAYHMLDQARLESPEAQLLNNYIPSCEILYGLCPDGTRGSVYIWTANDKQGKNFEEYLSEVRAHPEKLPEHKLYNILNALITLSGCIRLLHQANLLHLDIKPSNFLVLYDPDFNINPHSISLFDVNTLYSIFSDFPKIAGTDGYRAPEVAEGDACLGSDIYSIGAMLYQAVVIQKELSPLYRDELYGKLDALVSGSLLIRASESNSNIYLRDRLTTILRRTLARRVDDRYCCCEELIEDLEKARAYLVPDIFGTKLDSAQHLAILDSASQTDCSPTAVIQELLFYHPLYETAAPEETSLNVLLLGAGTYGQQFLDNCLQTGQMLGKTLRVTACSGNPELDRRLYLESRPALSRFVNVNGSLKKTPGLSCGELNFCPIPGGTLVRGDSAGTRKALSEILNGLPEGERYHYVFIALGDDELNHQTASCLTGALGLKKDRCVVNYLFGGRNEPANPPANPVLINRSLTSRAIHPDLDRMGFNTHLCWEDTLNLDLKIAREKYREKYYYASSLAYVLTIRSKLASVGIYDRDPETAARRFQEEIVDRRGGASRELFDRLVALEHRRWVLEKATSGWQGPTTLAGKPDYMSLARRGLTKDNAARRHPCLVPSTPATPLDGFTPEQWNTPGSHDKALDPLDRMSVELHRCFLSLARQFLRSQPMKKLELEAIRSALTGASESVMQEFERYQLCLKNILEGNRNYTKQFDTYEKTLRDALEALEPQVKKTVSSRLSLIRQAVKPVVESNLFRDYKRLDETLVTKIPFILTYRAAPYMAMAFDDGRLENGKNSVVFANVASATMINPKKITYLYYFDRHSSADLFTRKVCSVLRYFARRGMRCQVAFEIAFAPGTPIPVTEEVRRRFEELQTRKKLDSVKFFLPQDEAQASGQLLEDLAGRRVDLFDCSVPLFASPRQNLHFLHLATARFPHFEFDWKERRFLDTQRCGYLQYLDENAFIRIDDMFALMNAEDNKHYYPEFADVYQDLWRVYTGEAYLSGDQAFTYGVTNWNRLCNQLEQHAKENDQIAKITFHVDEHLETSTYTYYLSDFMYSPLELILNRLIESGAVLESSHLQSCNSDSCRLTIHTEHNIGRALDDLIDAVYDRAELSGLRVDSYTARNGIRTVLIRCDRLTVRELKLDNSFSLKVLGALHRLRLINQMRTVDLTDAAHPVVSFRYTSPRMKRLLTTAGEILEVYTYYDVKRQGYFDDIACSFEFRWESGDITNELDCVLTRGFRSIIIECKSRRELTQDYYYKLWAIAEQFGLGTKKVLIANTYDNNLAEENALNRTRGRQLGIITISDPDEIRNIGATLRSILEGTYQQDV